MQIKASLHNYSWVVFIFFVVVAVYFVFVSVEPEAGFLINERVEVFIFRFPLAICKIYFGMKLISYQHSILLYSLRIIGFLFYLKFI